MIRSRSEVTTTPRVCLLAVALVAAAPGSGAALPEPEALPSEQPPGYVQVIGAGRWWDVDRPPSGCRLVGADEIPGRTPGAEVRARSAEAARAQGANHVRLGPLVGDPPVRPTRLFACSGEALARGEKESGASLFAGSFSAADGLYVLRWDERPGRVVACERVGAWSGTYPSPERLAELARKRDANVALLDPEAASEAMTTAEVQGVFMGSRDPVTVRLLRCSEDSELLAEGILFDPVRRPDRGCAETGAATLVGLWETVETSKGGLGEVVEFRADGSFTQAVATIVDSYYRLSGDLLSVDDAPLGEDAPPSATRTEFRVRLEGDRLIATDSEGTRIEKKRFGEPADATSPLVGAWRYRPPYAGRRDAFERYTAEGRFFLRLPLSSSHGCYALRGNLVTLTSRQGDEKQVAFELRDDDLLLTGASGPWRYRRAEGGAWYGQEQLRDEQRR